MYNRYIPEDMSYTRIEPSPPPPNGSRPGGQYRPFRMPEFLSGKEVFKFPGGQEGGGLSSLIKALRLDKMDSGDVLLLLILLYLLVEGDDMELVIALGLVLIMGLGEENPEKPSC